VSAGGDEERVVTPEERARFIEDELRRRKVQRGKSGGSGGRVRPAPRLLHEGGVPESGGEVRPVPQKQEREGPGLGDRLMDMLAGAGGRVQRGGGRLMDMLVPPDPFERRPEDHDVGQPEAGSLVGSSRRERVNLTPEEIEEMLARLGAGQRQPVPRGPLGGRPGAPYGDVNLSSRRRYAPPAYDEVGWSGTRNA